MWSWSKNPRTALVAARVSVVIIAMAVCGVIGFGNLAGDSFPYVAGFGYNPDFLNEESQTLYQNLEWFCSTVLIGGVLLGLGSFAAYRIHRHED